MCLPGVQTRFFDSAEDLTPIWGHIFSTTFDMLSCEAAAPGSSLSLTDPSWLRLVRASAAADDGFEGLTEVVGEEVRGGDGLHTVERRPDHSATPGR
jgi:hypothetical protein